MSDTSPPVIFEACEPHEDVLEGRLEEDRFAASIAAVAHDPDNTPAIYSDAKEFYEKTYPTDGLVELMESIAYGVLESHGEETEGTHSNIIGLDTTFGGGKTHDLIASYHLVADPEHIDNLGDFLDGELTNSYRDLDKEMNVAVVDGEAISASNARSTDDPSHPPTKTIWGEIVYQLFGMDGYREIEELDNNRNVPGGDELKRLFQRSDAFNLILLDELALYLSDAASIAVEDNNLAELTTTFIFRLLGAISQVDNVTLVYSISESAYQDKAEDVREQIRQAENELGEIFKRKHRVITPTGDTEVGAVLQRRLFEHVDEEAAESFAEAYYDYYRNFPRTLPSDTEEPQYHEKLQREYPFHPALLSTLTNKVDSIPKFQKTRGALKLLASAIHHLWKNPPETYERHVIRTYDLTPAEPIIRKEISELSDVIEKLDAAVRADVYNDDGDSFGQQEDRRWKENGLPGFGSHITVTVLWNSLAAGKQAIGVTYSEMYLHVGHPDLQLDHYDTALANLTYKNDIEYACHYLYDEERVLFKGIPNVVRMVEQRRESITRQQAEGEVERNVRNAVGTGPFTTELFPQHVSEIPDDGDKPSLSIIKFEVAEIDLSETEEPPEIIDRFYRNTATSYDGKMEKRTYKNYVLFLVPDKGEITTAIDKAELYLAQMEVRDDEESIPDLTQEQVDKLDEDIARSKNLMREKARTAYRHLYLAGDDGDLEHVTVTSVSGNGRGDFQSSVIATLDEIDRVITAEDAGKAGLWVERKLWQKNRTRMTTQALQEQFAKKPGLPLLLNPKPLRKTVVKIVEEDGYAYWDGERGKAFWNPANDTPSNWNNDGALEDSPDVSTDIAERDVKISNQHVVYESMEALLEEHNLEGPGADTCAECGKELPADSTSSMCEECAEKPAECSSCGKEIPGSTKADEPIRCADCGGADLPPIDEGPGDGDIVLDQIRHQALANEFSGLTQLRFEVHGAKKFAHLDYLLQRRSIKEEDINLGVMIRGDNTGDGSGSAISIEYQGDVDGYQRLGHNTLERTAEHYEEPQTAAELTISFDPPRELKSDESEDEDVLSELASEVEGTGLVLHVRAEGVSDIEAADSEVEA